MFTRTRMKNAALAAISGAMLAAPVHAQDPQRVEVTGSRIKRVNAELSSPVETITAADIQATGAKTVLELMRTVPAAVSYTHLDVYKRQPQRSLRDELPPHY